MTVKNGDFVRIDYMESVGGQIIAATDREVAKSKGIFDEESQYGPRLVVVGAGQLVPGFEEDLVGKEIGYSGQVEIPPEKGFGKRDPTKVEVVPITRFKEEKPFIGMRVGIEDKFGVVTRIIGRKVSVDFNSPLADKTIVYDYKIVENIEDQQEKLKVLVKTFARIDMETKIEEDVAIIIMPWEMNYHKEWFMIRRGLADMILQHLGVKEVDYVERHTGDKVKAELISPPGKETEVESEEHVKNSSESSA
ncbi:MAG: peptidylprolyl isomerase [Methanotrichaceae archaeon]|nr:peptidylprolyl isomerase [Methanotrichaceae archaeon]